MLLKKDEKQTLKIGVLLPQSKEYPEIGVNYLNGIKLYFSLHDNKFERGEAELIVEDVALGTERLSLEKTRKLIAQDNVVMLVGLLEFGVGLQIGLTTQMADVPTLFAGLGESTVPFDYLPDNLFFHTLQFWQAHFHLGKHVAERFGDQKLHIVSSLLDCGYDHLRAFRLGLRAGGINNAEETILNAYDVAELKSGMDQTGIDNDAIYAAILHPKLLDGFIDHYGDSLSQVITTPFYKGKKPTKKIWAAGTPVEENALLTKFHKGMEEYLERPPDMYHMLGYQQGQIIYQSLQTIGDAKEDNVNIIHHLKNFDQETILGRSVMDQTDHTIQSGISICEGSSTQKEYRVLDKVHQSISAIDAVSDLYQQKNAFTNPYLFF